LLQANKVGGGGLKNLAKASIAAVNAQAEAVAGAVSG
jgi:hypothetical protein